MLLDDDDDDDDDGNTCMQVSSLFNKTWCET